MSKWGPLAERISGLAIDESFDMDYPNDSKSISRLRAGIGMTLAGCYLKFLVRKVPGAGIRVIRTGSWGCAIKGSETFQSSMPHPVLAHRSASIVNGLRPGCFFLGFLWGTALSPDMFIRPRKCRERACVFPAMATNDRCEWHIKSLSMAFSMTDSGIDNEFIWGTEDNPEPLLFTGFGYQLKRDDYCFEYKGQKRYDFYKPASFVRPWIWKKAVQMEW